METGYSVPVPAVERRDALHFLGWHGAALDEEMLQAIDDAEAELATVIRPHAMVRAFEYDVQENILKGTSYHPGGEDIRKLLSGCHSVMLMVATLGEDSDRLIRRTMITDSGAGLVMDAVASAMIEAICNAEEKKLRENAQAFKMFLTDRFSPGYGDMPLSDGARICSILEASKRIGLTVLQSGIMLPQKSVTAMIGVSHTEQSHRLNPCEVCSSREECVFREESSHV